MKPRIDSTNALDVLPNKSLPETIIRNYEPFLYKIVQSFGLVDTEAREMIREVCGSATNLYKHTDDGLLLRLLLSKRLVHKCIFNVSSAWFGKMACDTSKQNLTFSNPHNSHALTQSPGLQQMALSFRVVYLMQHTLGFSEGETAAILNCSVIQVRERFQKARAFLHNHS